MNELYLCDRSDLVNVGNFDIKLERGLRFLGLYILDCERRLCFRLGLDSEFSYKSLISNSVVEVVGVGDLNGVIVVGEKFCKLACSEIFNVRHVLSVNELYLCDRSDLVNVGNCNIKLERGLRFLGLGYCEIGCCFF